MLRSAGRALFQASWAAIMPRIAALLALLTVLLSSVLTASWSAAHPGGRAADGCHSCRTNCAQWGEVAGERHCHEERQKASARQNGQSPARQTQAAEDRPVEILGSVPRIVDADTLEVAGQKVRLQGIDAPNLRNLAGRRAGSAISVGTTPLRRSGRGSGRTRSPARLRAGTATCGRWVFATLRTART